MKPIDEHSGNLSLALALLLVPLFFLIFAFEIRQTAVTQEGNIGPRVLPIVLCICLLLGGIVELVKWSWHADARTFNLASSIIAIAMFIAAISVVGFTVSAWIFAVAFMLRLKTRLWMAVVSAMVLVLCTKFLFYHLFKVQLPGGHFELPI